MNKQAGRQAQRQGKGKEERTAARRKERRNDSCPAPSPDFTSPLLLSAYSLASLAYQPLNNVPRCSALSGERIYLREKEEATEREQQRERERANKQKDQGRKKRPLNVIQKQYCLEEPNFPW